MTERMTKSKMFDLLLKMQEEQGGFDIKTDLGKGDETITLTFTIHQ